MKFNLCKGLKSTRDKNLINRCKHGIDFDDAAKFFADTSRIEIFDKAHSEEEDRYITEKHRESPCFSCGDETPHFS